MFDWITEHPLSKDLKKAKDAVSDFNDHSKETMSSTVGVMTTKVLGAFKWVGRKINEAWGWSEDGRPMPDESEATAPAADQSEGVHIEVNGDLSDVEFIEDAPKVIDTFDV